MNKYSHIMVGELIFKHLKQEHGIQLEKNSFIKGNIIPDFSYYAIAHPHFLKLSLGFVQAEIDSLTHTFLKSAFIGDYYSYRLGIICHYYADFFCYAHSSGFKQAVINHLKYEHLLYLYFQENFDFYANLDLESSHEPSCAPKEINRKMLELHTSYSKLDNSFDNDLSYTLRACAETAAAVAYCSLTRVADEPQEFYREKAVI
jgi:hypothetical protein